MHSNESDNLSGFLKLLSVLIGSNRDPNEHRNTAPKEVGDKFSLTHESFAAYFIDVVTDVQIAKNMSDPDDLTMNHIRNNAGIVVELLEEKKIYMCGHCSNPHMHDCIVHYPGLDKSYYASLDTLIKLEDMKEI